MNEYEYGLPDLVIAGYPCTSTCSRIVMCTVSNSVRNTMLAVAYNGYGNTYGDAVGGYNYNS
jgi:hypothetical protein